MQFMVAGGQPWGEQSTYTIALRKDMDMTNQQEKKIVEQENSSESEPDQIKDRLLAEADAAETEEKAQLQELVEVAMGLKAPRPPVTEEPEAIEHITTHQIKSMRQVSAKRSNDKEPVTSQFMQGLIRMYCGITGMFSFSEDKTKEQCITKGHKCAHCGEHFDASNVTIRDDDAR